MLTFNFSPFPIIETERLTLRAMQHDDYDRMHAMRTDDDVQRFINRPKDTPDRTREVMNMIISECEANNSITWVISPKGSNLLMGTVGLWRVDKMHHKAEIGYMMFKEYWGQGFLTEALTPVMEYGFKVMKVHRVEGVVHPGNAASINVLKKQGFVKEGYFREDYYSEGVFMDSEYYAVLTPYK